jgi:hypothetical protein
LELSPLAEVLLVEQMINAPSLYGQELVSIVCYISGIKIADNSDNCSKIT